VLNIHKKALLIAQIGLVIGVIASNADALVRFLQRIERFGISPEIKNKELSKITTLPSATQLYFLKDNTS